MDLFTLLNLRQLHEFSAISIHLVSFNYKRIFALKILYLIVNKNAPKVQ